MQGLLTDAFLTSLVLGAITAGVPLLLAGLGEQISEKAGVLNIGIEGMMLVGAYCGFLVAYETGSIWLGFLGGAAGGAAGGRADGAALRAPRPEPDRHRHRADAGRRGPDRAPAPLPVQPDLSAPARRRDAADPAAVARSRSSGRRSSTGRPSSISRSRWSSCSPMPTATPISGSNLQAAGDKPAALDAAGVDVVAHARPRRAGDRRAGRHRRRLPVGGRRRASSSRS